MSVKWIEHKGKKVLFADYSHMILEPDLLGTLKEFVEEIRKQPGRVLSLSNYTGCKVSPQFMDDIKVFGRELAPKMGKTANVGITGIKSILYNAYIAFTGQKDNKLFNTEAEALDWLVS